MKFFTHATKKNPSMAGLVRAFKQQHPDFADWSVKKLLEEVHRFQHNLLRKHEPVGSNIREKLDETIIQKLLLDISNGGVRLFIRHGEQAVSPKVAALTGPHKKVAMMQMPNNMMDGLTTASAIEGFAMAMVMHYLSMKKGISVVVMSSINQRAVEVAAGLSDNYQLDKRLNCPNYRKNVDLSLLTKSGTVALYSKNFAKVCDKTLAIIQSEMLSICNEYPLENNKLIIFITHSQQLDYLKKEKFNLSLGRVNTFGGIYEDKHNEPREYREGLYLEKNLAANSQKKLIAKL